MTTPTPKKQKAPTTLLLPILLLILAACSSSDDTTPSMADTNRMEALMDASNEYIRNFRDQYGTYILYDFDDMQDFAYQFEEASAWRNTNLTRLDSTDINAALDLLDEKVFSLYSDDVKRNYFPLKLLLADKITYTGLLGTSKTQPGGIHYATASINSVTFGNLGTATLAATNQKNLQAAIHDYHFALIGGYMVGVLEKYPVSDDFFDYGSTYYRDLIVQGSIQAKYLKDFYFESKGTTRPENEDDIVNDSRIQAGKIQDAYFYERGFFPPESSSDTYYGSNQDDLVQFLRNVINMDAATFLAIYPYDVMRTKVNLVRDGLIAMGIDIDNINPIVKGMTNNIDDIVFPENDEDTEAEPEINCPVAHTDSKYYTVKISDPANSMNVYTLKVDRDYDIRLFSNGASGARQGYTTVSFGKSYLTGSYFDMEELEGSESYYWVLKYNNDGQVQKIFVVSGYEDDGGNTTYFTSHTYNFIYNVNQQLTRVTYDDNDIVTDVKYQNGRLLSYITDGTPYTERYTQAEDGSYVRINSATMPTEDYSFTGTERINPLYVAGLLPVIHAPQCSIPLDLIYNEYIFDSLGSIWQANWTSRTAGQFYTRETNITADDRTLHLLYQYKK